MKTENNDLRVKISKLESEGGEGGEGGGEEVSKLKAMCSELETGNERLLGLNESLKSELGSVHSQLDRLVSQQDSSAAASDLRITRIMEEAAVATKRAEEKVGERDGEVERLKETVENVKGQMSRVSEGANDLRNQLDAMKIR